MMFPGEAVNIKQIKFGAKLETESLHNFKLLQKSFNKMNVCQTSSNQTQNHPNNKRYLQNVNNSIRNQKTGLKTKRPTNPHLPHRPTQTKQLNISHVLQKRKTTRRKNRPTRS